MPEVIFGRGLVFKPGDVLGRGAFAGSRPPANPNPSAVGGTDFSPKHGPDSWTHRIAKIDGGGRVCGVAKPGTVLASELMTNPRWRLRPHHDGRVVVDSRGRVLVPLGVRYSLELTDAVILSHGPKGVIVLSAPSVLDSFVEPE